MIVVKAVETHGTERILGPLSSFIFSFVMAMISIVVNEGFEAASRSHRKRHKKREKEKKNESITGESGQRCCSAILYTS